MQSPAAPSPAARQAIVWWILWFAILNGTVMLRFFLGASQAPADPVMMVVPIAALAASAFVRFTLLPRQTSRTKALPFFICGLAMAESTSITGIILTGPRADVFVGLGLAMLLCYAPIFAKRYDQPVSAGPFRG